MTLVVVIFDGVALNTVFKFHRVDDVDLGDEHHGVGAGGDVLARLHVGGFKDDGGFDAVAFKEPVLDGADAVSFRHADEAFADGVGDVDGFAVSVPMGEFCRTRRHQNDLFVFNQHIIQAVGLLGRCNQPEVALPFGSQAFERIAAVLDEVDFDKRITLDEFRNDEREELDAALAGNADAHASMHLFFSFRDFRTQVAVDIQHRLRRLNITLTGEGQRDGVGCAVKDGCAQILLDELDGLRKRGLRDKELFAGGGNRAFVQNG